MINTNLAKKLENTVFEEWEYLTEETARVFSLMILIFLIALHLFLLLMEEIRLLFSME